MDAKDRRRRRRLAYPISREMRLYRLTDEGLAELRAYDRRMRELQQRIVIDLRMMSGAQRPGG